MLRLERTAHHRQINIIVYDKEHFLNVSLLIAFAVATAIHLALFLVFQITPLTPRMNEQIYPPMIVDADPILISGAAVLATPNFMSSFKDNLPPSHPLKPIFPRTPVFVSIRHSDSIKQNNTAINPFLHLEKDVYEVPLFALKREIDKSGMAIIISGPLSTHQLIKNGLSTVPITFQNDHSRQQRIVYSVVLDPPSGKIVWYSLKESSHSGLLDKLAEKILLDMQFARNNNAFIVNGEIELHFHHIVGVEP